MGVHGAIALGVCELIMAAALFTRARNVAILSALVIAGGGVALTLLVPTKSCGCFGSFVAASMFRHLTVAGVMGFWACVALANRMATAQR